jgi:hypothetical protein
MPTPTYVSLATYTVTGSADASVEFSSIPATYRDLICVVVGTSNSDQRAFYIRFNGAAAESNTSAVYAQGNGSTTTSFTDTGLYIISDDQQFSSIFQVMDYSATDKHKTVLIRNNNNAQVWMGVGRWAQTTAVNSITLDRSGFTWSVGTTFSLYGIAA